MDYFFLRPKTSTSIINDRLRFLQDSSSSPSLCRAILSIAFTIWQLGLIIMLVPRTLGTLGAYAGMAPEAAAAAAAAAAASTSLCFMAALDRSISFLKAAEIFLPIRLMTSSKGLAR